MRYLVVVASLLYSVADAQAQQQPIPLTDWRAAVDADLARVSMPRDAHNAVFSIMQAYEQKARKEMPQTAPFQPPSSLVPTTPASPNTEETK